MNINAINFIYENGENLLIDNNVLSDIVITNLDQNGLEKKYDQTLDDSKLYANFLHFKINNNLIDPLKLKRLIEKKDIVELIVMLKDKKMLRFDIPSDADPFSNNYRNNYQIAYNNERYTNIILSEHKIKYSENMFA